MKTLKSATHWTNISKYTGTVTSLNAITLAHQNIKKTHTTRREKKNSEHEATKKKPHI